ncbi:hypothetical protein Lser_V15G14451 [Lactuca serriola]
MELKNILHMNVGNGESSYARNSFLQETVIRKTLPVLKSAVKGMANLDTVLSKCFVIADLGCSNGPNTLLAVSIIIDVALERCREDNHHKAPQFQVFLNDLYGNDFNAIFQSLPNFYANFRRRRGKNFLVLCVLLRVPSMADSFKMEVYTLFTPLTLFTGFLRVPEGIENNKGNIYMAKTSPPNVFEAYRKQFHADMKMFLQMRSSEIVRGGCMVLTFLGRSSVDPTSDDCCSLWGLLGQSLHNMAKEKLVQESDINTFNAPVYFPCEDEVRNVIHDEGSFSLDTLNAFQLNWDPYDTDYTSMKAFNEQCYIHGKNTAMFMRAVTESLLVSHFGDLMNTDVLFKNMEKQVAEHLTRKKTRHFTLVISLTRK